MIKHGAIQAGKTPSEVSGRQSEIIKEGAAVRRDEEPPAERIEDVRVPVEDPDQP